MLAPLCALVLGSLAAVEGVTRTQSTCLLHRHEELKVMCNGTVTQRAVSFFRRNGISGQSLQELVVYNVSEAGFNPNFLKNFTGLRKLSIINSSINYFINNFPHHDHLQVLNLSRLHLTDIREELLLNLKVLKVLDLSYNQIHHLNAVTLKLLGKLNQIYLKGDSWNCSYDLKWILSKKSSSVARKIVDIDQMTCNELNYTGKPVIEVMNFIKGVETDCPRNGDKQCACYLENIVWSQPIAYLVPIITVNCSGLQWKKMPDILPVNTTTVLLQHNQIKDLTPLIRNGAYGSVADIYLDHNLIEDVSVLEHGKWLSRCRVFSISNNRMRSLPAHVFRNAFSRNYHIAEMYLGNNPWSCDCAFASAFKDLIAEYNKNIKDAHSIRCRESLNDPNSMKMIHTLSASDICLSSSNMWLGPIDILNIILAALIILVLGNLLYDYWRFKTSGKLPWIVLKMP